MVDPATYRERYEELMHKDRHAVLAGRGLEGRRLRAGGRLGRAGAGDLARARRRSAAKADPTIVQADPRPDWYFLWYFALLALIPPSIEDAVHHRLPAASGGGTPALPLVRAAGERSPFRRPWAVGAVGLTTLSIATLIWYGSTSPWSPNFNPAPLPNRITQGLTGPAARGAQLFESESCSKCHTIAGTGGQRGPDLTTVGRRLNTDELTWRIANGGNNMPAFGAALQSDELDALVAFLAQLKSGS